MELISCTLLKQCTLKCNLHFRANALVHLLAQILARYSKRVVIGTDFGSSLHTLDLMDNTNFALCRVATFFGEI